LKITDDLNLTMKRFPNTNRFFSNRIALETCRSTAFTVFQELEP